VNICLDVPGITWITPASVSAVQPIPMTPAIKVEFARSVHPREVLSMTSDIVQIRDLVELVGMVVIATVVLMLQRLQVLTPAWLVALILLTSMLKTVYFMAESLWHLLRASVDNRSYHRYLVLMAANMAQFTLSYAIDFYCLHEVHPDSFNGVDPAMGSIEEAFEFLFFSVLNFTFFGFGDVTPATMPAKLITLMEIGLSFLTLIFLLSDFSSIKASLRGRKADQ
jgi:hypothetical protein